MPIVLKGKQHNPRTDLKAFCVGRLASIQAELIMEDNPQTVPKLVEAGYLMPGEGLEDLNVFQVFRGVDWEEGIEDNLASIEEDSWRVMKAARIV